MSLPSPRLDDRTFESIFQEAVRRIPAYCPEWTDYNESDPGITLVQLMAWLADMVIYRLNRVPEKSFVEFLNLMGVEPRTAQPARSTVVFGVRPGAAVGEAAEVQHREAESVSRTINEGTQVATERLGASEAVVFETRRPLSLTTAQLVHCISTSPGADTLGNRRIHTPRVLDPLPTTPFAIFDGAERAEHSLLLGDERLAGLDENTFITVSFKTVLGEEIGLLDTEWEFWDGHAWQSMVVESDSTGGLRTSGSLAFRPIRHAEVRELQGIESCWIRCRLLGISERPGLPQTSIPAAAVVMRKGCSVLPTVAFSASADTHVPLPVDLSRDFLPFLRIGRSKDEPPVVASGESGDAFLIGSDDVLSHPGARISLHIQVAEGRQVNESADLTLTWEYSTGENDWRELDVADTTRALTTTGEITFTCPDDIARDSVLGAETFWIRVRVNAGSYGGPEGAPRLRSLRLSFRERPRRFEHCLTCNHGEVRDITAESDGEREPLFAPFAVAVEASPAFCIGLDRAFANRLQSIYIGVEEEDEKRPRPLESPPELVPRNRVDLGRRDSLTVRWEYWSATSEGWKELPIERDATRGFAQAGCIEFFGPPDLGRAVVEGRSAFWIRATWLAGYRGTPVRLNGLWLNAVEAVQAVSQQEEILGSSNGRPSQRFVLSQSPILSEPEPEVWVREREDASSEQIAEVQRDVKSEDLDIDEKDVWIRWHARGSLSLSGPDARHYVLDPFHAAISFGDGLNGRIPPKGRSNVRCRRYYTGGGRDGNVAAGAINTILSATAAETVRNIVPAFGGADAETVGEAKARAPFSLRHRFRAVTASDYEELAREASPEVGRVRCIPTRGEEGSATVIVVPAGPEDRPMPTARLIRHVEEYLDRRRLVTARVHVVKPTYRAVSVRAGIVLKADAIGASDEVARRAEARIRAFFHPLRGGPENDGWEFGRPVHISEIYYLLESEPRVDHVHEVVLNEDPAIERIMLEENDLVHLRRARIDVVSSSTEHARVA